MLARRHGWVLVAVLAVTLAGHLCPPSALAAGLDHGETAAASLPGEPLPPGHRGHHDGHRGHHETHLGACEPGARVERPGVSSVAPALAADAVPDRAPRALPLRVVATWRVAVPPGPPDPLFLRHSVLLI